MDFMVTCLNCGFEQIISAFPTLGSVYYWVAQLVPKKHACTLVVMVRRVDVSCGLLLRDCVK